VVIVVVVYWHPMKGGLMAEADRLGSDWFKGQQPPGAVLHSSRKLGEHS